jgi:hypothetical protein
MVRPSSTAARLRPRVPAELAPYVGPLSSRTSQISRNVDRYEAEWRADHPGEEPGRRLRQAWDRCAWAEGRPEKPGTSATSGRRSRAAKTGQPTQADRQTAALPSSAAEMVATWNRVLHQLGYRDPAQIGLPLVPAGPSIGSLDRDAAAEVVISGLGAARSAWNSADIRGAVEQWLAATGLVAEASARTELAEDITARALALSMPLLDQPGVPRARPRSHLRAGACRRGRPRGFPGRPRRRTNVDRSSARWRGEP